LKTLAVEFITSAGAGGSAALIPRDGLPQVAMAGRSNVGKSTLINALVRRKIARTSAAPGKTRLANIFRVTVEGGAGGPGRWSFYLADLPGYGYARGGENAAAALAVVAAAYFEASTPATLLLVDSRHPGLESDAQAARWLSTVGSPPVVVATKIDKLSRAERTRNLRELERIFGTPAVPVSATSGEGLDALWRLIAKWATDRATDRHEQSRATDQRASTRINPAPRRKR
jgi:GTP-binding protein